MKWLSRKPSGPELIVPACSCHLGLRCLKKGFLLIPACFAQVTESGHPRHIDAGQSSALGKDPASKLMGFQLAVQLQVAGVRSQARG